MRRLFILLFSCLSLMAMAQSEILSMAEVMPQYKGGDAALAQYLKSAIVYPQDAKDQQVQGRLMVQFVVEPDGSLSHLQVMRSAGLRSLDNEGLRVVLDMQEGAWSPAQQKGQPVRCYYTLPITFRLP